MREKENLSYSCLDCATLLEAGEIEVAQAISILRRAGYEIERYASLRKVFTESEISTAANAIKDLIKEKLPSPNEMYTDAELTGYARQYAFVALNAIEEMKNLGAASRPNDRAVELSPRTKR